jgi:hypothetical protein
MNRADVRGWTWRLGRVWIEFVTVRHALRGISIDTDNGRRLVRRWEW